MDDRELRKNYDIDNCRPIATFNQSDIEYQYDKFHFRNTQLLLKFTNYSKGAKRNLDSGVLQELKAKDF